MLKLSTAIEFHYNFAPVWKLRPKLTVRYGIPRAIPSEKLNIFEARVAAETARQFKAQGFEGQFRSKDGDRVAIEMILRCSTKAGDTDNYVKAVTDGINKSGIMQDDNLVDLVVATRVFVPKGKESFTVRLARIEELEEGFRLICL